MSGLHSDPLLAGLEHHQPRLNYRILIAGAAALLVLGLLLGRLFQLQVLEGQTYHEKARSNRLRSSVILAPRGNIYDRQGKVLATNKEAHALQFDPRRLSNAQIYVTLRTLAQYLERPYEELRDRLDFENPEPVFLYHDLNSRELALILEHKERLPGVSITTSMERYYPSRDLTTHFLGHMGHITAEDLEKPAFRHYYPGTLLGKNGLEKTYEPFLKGTDGKDTREAHLHQEAASSQRVAPLSGNNLTLTIDKELQAYCYRLLQRRQIAGSIVVMHPQTGALLALASYPSYDPNLFNRGLSQKQWNALQKNRLHPFLDRSTNAYAPGSIFKVITTLAGLGTGHLTPQRSFISRGFLKVRGHTFYDWNRAGFGTVNIEQALAYSIDTVFYELSQEMGIEPIRDYARLFGLGAPSGIDLPLEAKGIVPDQGWKSRYIGSEWLPGDSVNASIGQGYVQMTPIQATRMVAAVANGGYLVTPHLVQEIQGTGDVRVSPRPQPSRIPGIPPEHWRVVQEGLESAVSYGTAKGMRLSHVRVAGKTGTAETIPGQPNHAWIVGYAPAEKPEYALTVFLEHGVSGGGKAAPVAKEVFAYLFKETTP